MNVTYMKLKSPSAVAILIGLAIAGPSTAADRERAPQLQRLVDCKAIADADARLACYDREVASLDQAEKSKDLVVVDKEQVKKARRTLFGLALPRIDLFGGDQPGDELNQIEGKVTQARSGVGGLRIVLEDGSIWQQTDDKPIFRDPKPGDAAVVTRGVLGSFFMKIGNATPIKVRRVV